jgi:biopolymer transport protein ExbD
MRRRRAPVDFRLDIAPVNLIDLLLVLLIFFVTTTSFLQLQVIDLTLPKTDEASKMDSNDDVHVVNIDLTCNIFLDKKAVPLEALATTLETMKTEHPKHIFRVGADAKTAHECFVNVLEAFQKAQITNIAILTKPSKE